MSKGKISKSYTVFCFACDQWEWSTECKTIKEFREVMAGTYDWNKIKGKYYCPDCSYSHEKQRTKGR